jgi:CHASE2 domain-containing sensor protein/tRNA A-37 threonylcarbamoyl transferase component Bud32
VTRARRVSRRVLSALLVLVSGTLCGVAVGEIDGPLERASVDWRYGLRGDHAPSREIVIVAIDDDTLRRLGERPPVSRRLQARVVDRLTRAGAAVIAYDLTLAGRTATDADADSALVAALRGAPAAVVSVTNYDAAGTSLEPLAGIASFGTTVRPASTLRDFGRREGTWVTFTPPMGALDGFPAAVAAQFRRAGRVVPPRGALIDYAGPSLTYPRISFADVLSGRDATEDVRGRIVVVADTRAAGGDLHAVPVGGRMAGGELQANAIATALEGFPLREVSPAVSTLSMVGLAGLLGGLFLLPGRRREAGVERSLDPLVVVAAGIGLALAWALAAYLAFGAGAALDFMPGLAVIGAGTLVDWVLATRDERARYAMLRQRLAEGATELVEAVRRSGQTGVHRELHLAISGYALKDVIGRGGMGIVWLATHRRLGRDVALKVIDWRFHDDLDFRRRFMEEARVAAQISHPNVITVYNMDADGDILFIEMEVIEGRSLDGLLASLSTDLLRVVALMHRIAVAVDAVHAKGFVHCDVKPGNVMIGSADPDHPYLGDFGLAKRPGGPVLLNGRWAGSSDYAAPEQSSGGDVGFPADIYAMGVMVFEALTGRLPFAHDDRDELPRLHREAPRPAVSQRNPMLPAALDEVVRRAMAIDPGARPATASAFTAEVLEIVRSIPTPPSPTQPANPSQPTDVL